jgi:copper resistance protein B
MALGAGTSLQALAQDHEDRERHAASHGGVSQQEHVPPDPPQLRMPDMPAREMVDMMGMDDRAPSAHVVVDELEWRDAGGNPLAWDTHAWYGRDEGKLWLKAEGERVSGGSLDASVELLFDRNFSRWWSFQTGARHDFGEGPSRSWLALGVQGLAPYFFEVEATAYLGEGSRAALKLRTEYELLFTQRLILQPSVELNIYSKEDTARDLGSGLADTEIGVRLRYEIRRQFAPYLGIVHRRLFAGTRDLSRSAGKSVADTQFTAGFRFWY